jgi:hypothetical protein
MSRDSAVSTAAFYGFIGLVLFSVGSLIASALISAFSLWFAAVPALLVWSLFGYLGLKHFAYGVYTIVEDAVER